MIYFHKDSKKFYEQTKSKAASLLSLSKIKSINTLADSDNRQLRLHIISVYIWGKAVQIAHGVSTCI